MYVKTLQLFHESVQCCGRNKPTFKNIRFWVGSPGDVLKGGDYVLRGEPILFYGAGGLGIGFFFCNNGLFLCNNFKCCKNQIFATILLQKNVARFLSKNQYVAKQNVANFLGQIELLQKINVANFLEFLNCCKTSKVDNLTSGTANCTRTYNYLSLPPYQCKKKLL